MTQWFRRFRLAVLAAAATALVMASVGGATHAGAIQIGHINVTPSGEGTTLTCSNNNPPSQIQCFYVQSNTAGTDPTAPPRAIEGTMTAATGGGIGVFGQTLSTSTAATGVLGSASQGVGTKGTGYGESGIGVYGFHTLGTGTAPGVAGDTSSTSTGAIGVRGRVTATTGGGASAGVFGNNASPAGHGVLGNHDGAGSGVTGISQTGYGVQGQHQASSGDKAGVYGNTFSPDDLAAGVKGETSGGGGLVTGVYGTSPTGMGVLALGGPYGIIAAGNSLAGLFLGNVHVTGTLSKSAGSFKIDHPLEPATMYLQHSFVESPDMKNVYDGVVTTDAKGFATVRLPRYFGALNRSFRYQLTPIGRDAWDARAGIWQEIRGNRFVIRSEPDTKISWQVTGIRKDRYANAHRIQPELKKAASEQGKYLNPELYGKPASQTVLPLSTKGLKAARN